ncbi:prepilin-type N-terminal cleavage/methylation domain-containing protein [Marinihelvus fidelis]|uniref:Prepilin-type N-terminal cleavage/methylation domain-containing protein n=1 Tax=Marinihelvus fidelis TaxID=2613842 RepID=A0A5N0T5L6_9GAMM|nr:pilin [Marinihelvus fidelis]KAA9129754.1 prepilin-type N-terminal cleavage/methylation domain-containing protein [Marinihelvus fidelis]
MTKQIQKGFTLIELMIVIAIVAILVALAVPAYQDYTIRAKVGECINQAAPAKLAVSEYFQSEGNFAGSEAAYGFDTANSESQYCNDLVITPGTGRITVQSTNTGADVDPGAFLTPEDASGAAYNPTSMSGPINWDCTTNGTGALRHLPATCRQ